MSFLKIKQFLLIFISNIYYKRYIFLPYKSLIFILFDSLLFYITLYFAFFKGSVLSNISIGISIYLLFIISNFLGIFLYNFSGQYKSLTKYINSLTLYGLAYSNLFISFFIFITSKLINFEKVNLVNTFNFWFIFTLLTSAFRFVLRDLILYSEKYSSMHVAIYGGGSAGVQLLSALRMQDKFKVKCILDDDPNLHGLKINGINIYDPTKLSFLKEKYQLKKILLAIPSVNSENYKNIISKLSSINLPILKVPSISALASSNSIAGQLSPIKIEDLLFRKSVAPIPELLKPKISQKIICVFGAAGSIGSEIFRQLIKLNPKKLILIDNNEYNLFKLNEEIKKKNFDKLEIKLVLGSANNSNLISSIFKNEKVEIVYHAAAYKHVPLVQNNPIDGIENNVFSTLKICQESVRNNVRKVIFISTDKAVRPTNIMGTSKRLGELILQAFAEEYKNHINFSCVRFGNVLGSSGSVVPLFDKQIKSGGPILITDIKMTRYFMTTKEAAELVIQASGLSKSGEVFLLDMGQPIKVIDLAKLMIKLNGLTIKDENNKNGDIEIKEMGIRPGEKLYEELLISSSSSKTIHPLIFNAEEEFIPYSSLMPKIDKLKKSIEVRNLSEIKSILLELVPEWIDEKGN